MNIIMCVDENSGMTFNNRRQSRDKTVIEHIAKLVGEKTLWISPFSQKLFKGQEQMSIVIDDNYLKNVPNGEYCFVEDKDISDYTESIEKLILFKWNRSYPADTFLTLDLSSWNLIESEDLGGHSHDKITKEVYTK